MEGGIFEQFFFWTSTTEGTIMGSKAEKIVSFSVLKNEKGITRLAEGFERDAEILEDQANRCMEAAVFVRQAVAVLTGDKPAVGARPKRNPRGKTLRQAIHAALAKSDCPLGASVLRDKVLNEEGYETSAKPHSFYTAVYNTANQDLDIVRTKEGFCLKKGKGGTKKKAKKNKKA